MVGKRKIFSIFVMGLLVIFVFSSAFIFSPMIMIGMADPGNINENWHNGTTLNVTVLDLVPRINWYDFQFNNSGSWDSRRNSQVDVNNSAEYRFIVNISSDQGWDDIEYINITAWYDNGNEGSIYNQTLGGNANLFLQYENLTGTANYTMLWPDNEATAGSLIETTVTDPLGSSFYTDCYNITFAFIPGYQCRYAPGDGAWDNTSNTTNDVHSWNFNISVADSGENASGSTSCWVNDEFGIYSYAEVASAGWPTIAGNPGQNATADSNITLITRSNGNHSLSVDVDDLLHTTHPTANISNGTVWVRGGNLTTSSNFTGSGPLYLYGSNSTYETVENNGTGKTTNDIEYKCNIPFGQQTGDYEATIRYRLTTEL